MKLVYAILIIFFQLSIYSQDRMITHLNSIPQSNQNNPATTIPYKFYIGIPALSSIGIGLEVPFSKTDLFYLRADDSLVFSQDKLLNSLKKNNLIHFENRINLIDFGFRIKNNFFSFSNSVRTAIYLTLPKDLFQLIIKGNASFMDENVLCDLSKLRINGSVWNESAFGYQSELTNKINIGAKVKVLYGYANINTRQNDFYLKTDPSNYNWTIRSNFEFNMSAIVDTSFDFNTNNLIKNQGLAFDLGGEYKLNDKISFGLSLLDFGFINWKTNTQRYTSTMQNEEFTFSGVNFKDVFLDNGSDEDSFENILDSLEEQFQFNDSIKANYHTGIYPKLCFSGFYKLGENNKFGLFSRNDIANKTMFPSFTLSYNRKLGKIFEFGLSYSMIYNNWQNLGLGYSLKLGPCQTYMSFDNLLNLTSIDRLKNMYFRFGINLVFGKYNLEDEQ